MKLKGKILWYDQSKGHGFIKPSDGNAANVFIHYSAMGDEQYGILFKGDTVEYDLTDGPTKGPQANEAWKMSKN